MLIGANRRTPKIVLSVLLQNALADPISQQKNTHVYFCLQGGLMHAQSIRDKGVVRQLTGIVVAADPRSAEMMPKGNPMEPVCHR